MDRKSQFIRDNLSIFRAKLSLSSDQFEVRGLLVTEGYGGHPSHKSDIPIVPSAVLKAMLTSSTDLGSLHRILCSPLWLPRPGIDCEPVSEVYRAAAIELGDLGLALTSNHYLEENLSYYVEEAATLSEEEISLLEW